MRPLSEKPPIALAHSMGAHILLRTLHDKPGAIRAAVLTAPMLAISTRGYPGWLTRMVTSLYSGFGFGGDFAWGMAARDPFLITFDTQLVTSDRARFSRAQDFLKTRPDLRLAGPTWGWIEAAYRSMTRVNAPGYAEAISAPVLVCGAGKDRIVLTEAERVVRGAPAARRISRSRRQRARNTDGERFRPCALLERVRRVCSTTHLACVMPRHSGP